MSTTPTTPTLDDLRQAAVNADTPTPATPAPPSQPQVTEVDGIKYGKTPEGKLFAELPTGAKYLGDNEQQLAINIARGKVEADRTLQQWKQQQSQPVQQPQAPQEDPTVVAARQYMLDEIAKGLGLNSGQELAQNLQHISQVASSSTDDQIAAQFYQLAPDFPTTEQNVETLTKMVEDMGLPMTPYGLQAAHLIAVNQGKYKPLTPQEIQAQKMQALGINPATVTPPVPAPVLPGQASVPNSGGFNPYDRKVSLDEVRKWAMEQK